MEQEPGPRITNLQLLQLLFRSLIQQCGILHDVDSRRDETPREGPRASKLQNKKGQQDVDVQFGLVSAK